MSYQCSKEVVRNFYNELEETPSSGIPDIIKKYTIGSSYFWRGMHPFNEVKGSDTLAVKFWQPLMNSFNNLERRQDIFFAGHNEIDEFSTQWVCSMGHLVGNFNNTWLNIPPTGKIVFLRYAEFNKVVNQRITETALFFDILNVMLQAGFYPLPPQTGTNLIQPGPKNHDGLLLKDANKKAGNKTLTLINRMMNDINHGMFESSYDELEKTWHPNMVWWGPTGIGASYTFEKYIEHHQQPFRTHLTDRKFNGHICRLAEGNFGGFFGWPNLTVTMKGGFMGLTASNQPADMRVVDIYRRDRDKLAENWVFIDMLHFLNMQGLDVLSRLSSS